ncbi:type IV toxin-antitoxin system AbiEi family antitoxin domain-containing protein [Isoptericola jiangsuensis]|uniref:type IV toxin-antitoxin system AbiEi family antitoxin domain-containing protein n=1 Tax=Isoptericola jiangsuensis TaxID=548579 RepID=UPI003AAEDA09
MHPRTVEPLDLLHTARTQCGLVDVDQCHAAGLSRKAVRGLVDRGRWRRVAHRVLEIRAAAPSSSDLPARRRRSAWLALLTYGPEAVAVGACALALHGIAGLPTSIRSEAALPDAQNRRDRPGSRVRQFDDGLSWVQIDGRRVATLDWALAQAVPELPVRHGLAVLDAALHSTSLDLAGLTRSHELARGRRGVATRHLLWSLADGRSESPLESFARWECIEGGVPPDTLQLPLSDRDGRTLARGDLGWRRGPHRWLVVEMDGVDVHGAPTAVFADRRRQNLFTGSGAVDLLRFTGRDLGTIASTVRSALAR